MRKSPDGTRNVTETKNPITGSISKTYRFSGEGIADVISVVDPETNPMDYLQQLTTPLKRYHMFQEILDGLVPLPHPSIDLQKILPSDGAEGIFGTGTSDWGNLKTGEIEVNYTKSVTAAWAVSTPTQSFVLVAPLFMNSFELRRKLENHLKGEFLIEKLTFCDLAAGENVAPPGFRNIVGVQVNWLMPPRRTRH